ncbi:ATP-binding cassette domain-containing protein [Streptomyces sp. NPDC002588]|uniref:ATP-binding cassette domain-containing protein n=1 Tax=Streptomyces sp. NPDC002588 TaxID=3154419 RepID=UPI00332BF0D0
MIQAFGLTSDSRKELPPAVDDVSLEARAGRVTVLLGATGAGKSTALRLMLELQQGRGLTHFRGRPLHRIAHPSREVGVLLGDVPGHPARTVRGHLRMLCAAAGVPVRRADEVLEVVGLISLRDERLSALSRGMDRRLGLACALLADPHTLVLDEPTAGLSGRENRWLHGMLRAHAAHGGTVLVTTSDPKEAARTADRVVTLDKGRLVADQEAADFARTRLRPRVVVRSPHAARLAALLAREARTGRRSVEVVQEDGNRLCVYGSTCAEVGETAFRHGILVHQLADETGDMGPGSATGAGIPEQTRPGGRAESVTPTRTGPEAESGGGTGIESEGGAEAPLPPAPGGGAHTSHGLRVPSVGAALAGGESPYEDEWAHGDEWAYRDEWAFGEGPLSLQEEQEEGDGPVSGSGRSVSDDAPPMPDHVARPRLDGTIDATYDSGASNDTPPTSGDPAGGESEAPSGLPPAPEGTPRPLPEPVPLDQPLAVAGPPCPPEPAPAPGGLPFESLSALPPPISVRSAPSPLRPLRYELRRAAGIGTSFLTGAAVLLASALIAVLLARAGHSSQARLLTAWPVELPLPPAALGAGLLGALAFGDEFRHPALAADRGTVPRRLGLLTAKLLVAGLTALMLAFLAVGCDAEVLYLLYGREFVQVPADWLTLSASWLGLVVGCAWAGVLAAGVFRSTTAGLAAVLAVPVAAVPVAQKAAESASVRTAAGFSLRLREVLLVQWPFGGERYLSVAARVIAQPVGGALALSLTALLCAYLLTTLRSRVR